MKMDTVIIGGGVIGLATARELARAGQAVTVLERGAFGREASWAGGGILCPLYPWRYADPVNHLALAGADAYPELVEELRDSGAGEAELRQGGMRVMDREDSAQAQAWAQRMGRGLRIAADGSLELPWVGQVRNPRLLRALQWRAEAMGVTLRPECPVAELKREGDAWCLETREGPMWAQRVVLCAGAWSGGLLPDTSLQVGPVHGQMLAIQARPDTLSEVRLCRGHYLIPRLDGLIVVGSTMERFGFEKRTTQEAREELQAAAAEMLPGLDRYPVVAHWSGLRPGAPAGIPYIGEHPAHTDLWLNTGHFRNGLCMAPAAARLLVDLMLGREPALDPAPFALGAARA